MFTNVIRAIVDLKNDEGVTIKSISEQLRCYIKDPKEQKKDCQFLAQVRRALRHGISSGIIVRDGKKYKLELDNKNARQKEKSCEEPMEICNETTPITAKSIESVSDIIDVLPEMKPSVEEKSEKISHRHRRRKREGRRRHSLQKLDSRKASNAFCNLSLMLNSWDKQSYSLMLKSLEF